MHQVGKILACRGKSKPLTFGSTAVGAGSTICAHLACAASFTMSRHCAHHVSGSSHNVKPINVWRHASRAPRRRRECHDSAIRAPSAPRPAYVCASRHLCRRPWSYTGSSSHSWCGLAHRIKSATTVLHPTATTGQQQPVGDARRTRWRRSTTGHAPAPKNPALRKAPGSLPPPLGGGWVFVTITHLFGGGCPCCISVLGGGLYFVCVDPRVGTKF